MPRNKIFFSLMTLLGLVLCAGPVGAQTQIWSCYLTNQDVNSSPALYGINTYVGAGNNLFCVDLSGTKKWTFPTGGRVDSSPAISDSGGVVYVGANDGKLYAIDEYGNKLWDVACPGAQVTSSPAVAKDGTIYFTDSYGKLYAVSPSGSVNWSLPAIGNSSPAIDRDGTIYVGVSAISPDGKVKGFFDTEGGLPRNPVIGDGVIYLATSIGRLFAFNTADYSRKWVFDLPDTISSAPALSSTGLTIYLGCDDGNLYAIGSAGTLRWTYYTQSPAVQSSPAIDAAGNIYVGSDKPALHAINPDGTEKWVFPTTYYRLHSSPAIDYYGGGGAILIGGYGSLYKIECDKGLSDSKWPMFRQNLHRNGRLAQYLPPLVYTFLLMLLINN